MADTRRLVIDIVAKESATAEFQKVQAALRSVGIEAKTAGTNATEASRGFSSLQTSIISLNQALELAKKAFEFVEKPFEDLIHRAEEFQRLSREFNIPTAELSNLQRLAGAADVSLEGLLRGMKTLATQSQQLRFGLKESERAFGALHLSTAQVEALMRQGLLPLWTETVRRLSLMSNTTERTATAAKLLGRTFGESLAAFAEAGGDMDAFRQRTHELGAVLDELTTKQLTAIANAAKDAGEAFLGLILAVSKDVGAIGGVKEGFDSLTEALIALRQNAEVRALFRDIAASAVDAAKSFINLAIQVAQLVAAFLQLRTGLEPLEILNLAVQGFATTVTSAAIAVDTLAVSWHFWMGNAEAGAAAQQRLTDDVARFQDIILRAQQGVQRLSGQWPGFVGPMQEIGDAAKKGGEGLGGPGGLSDQAEKARKKLAELRVETRSLGDQLELQIVQLGQLQNIGPGIDPTALRALTQEQERSLAIAKNHAEAEKAIATAREQYGAANIRGIEEQIRVQEQLKNGLVDVKQATDDAGKAAAFWAGNFRDQQRELRVLTGQITAGEAEVERAVDAARAAGIQNTAIIEAQTRALVQARKEAEGLTNLFDTASGIGKDFFDSVILGDRKFSDFAKTVPASIGKMFEEGFIKGLKAKTDFDDKFQVNIFSLVKNAGEVLTGQRGIGAIFDGAFKGAGATMQTVATQAANTLGVIPSAAEQAAQQSSEALHGIATASESSATQASSAWGGFFGYLLQLAESVIGQVISLFGGLIQAISGLFGGGGAGGGGAGIFGGITKAASSVFGEGGAISKAFGSISDLLGGAGFLGWVGKAVGSVFGENGVISGAFTTIKGYFTGGTLGTIFNSIKSLVGVIGGGFAAFHGVMTLFNSKATALQRVFGGGEALIGISTAFRSLQTLLPQFARFVQNVVAAPIGGTLGPQIGGTVGITDFAKALFTSSGFKEALSGIADPIVGIVQTLGGLLLRGLSTIAPQIAAALAAQGGTQAAPIVASIAANAVATSITAVLGPLVAGIAAAYSIAQGVKGIVDNYHALSKIERGDAAAGRTAAIQGINLAAGVAGGAAIGALVGSAVPVIGTLVGALVGAAVGASLTTVINAQLTKLIATVVSSAQRGGLTGGFSREQIRQGTSQAQLASEIKSGVGQDKLLLALGGPIHVILTELLSGLVTPDIETIFDKIFTQTIAKALGRTLNRQLEDYLGQGVVGAGRRQSLQQFRQGGELRGPTQATAALISGLIGAGSENADRIQRFFLILANNLASGQKSAAGITEELYKIVRGVTGSLTLGLSAVNVLFEGGAKRAEQTRKEVDLVARSYQKIVPGIDLSGIVAANQRATGGVNVRGVRQDLRVDVLQAAINDSLEITKRMAVKLGDSFLYAVTQFQTKVPAGVDTLAIALEIAQQRLPHALQEFILALRKASLEAAAGGAEYTATQAKGLGDILGVVAATIQESLPDAINAFALALGVMERDTKSAAAQVRELSRAVKLQSSLLAAGLPLLAPEEAAARVPSGRGPGARQAFKDVTADVSATQAIKQFLDQAVLSAVGAGAFGATLLATTKLNAASTNLNATLALRAKHEANLQIAVARGDDAWAKSIRQKLATDRQNTAQFAQAAIEAVKSWGDAVLSIIDQLRSLRTAAEDFSLQIGETIDNLRQATGTADRYNNVIDLTAERFNRASSAAAKLEIINRVMDLLQRQAQAAIQDVQEAADAQKKLIQARLDTIDKELEAVSALAGLLDGIRTQMQTLRIDAAGGGASSLRQSQIEIARQQALFRTGTPAQQAAAAQQIQTLSTTAIDLAKTTFGPASLEFRTIQRRQLGALVEIEAGAAAAAAKQEALQGERDDLAKKMAAIDEQAAKDIAEINRGLAAALTWLNAVARPLFGQQAALLRAQLATLLPGRDIEALLNDPMLAQLAVQQEMVRQLDEIRVLLGGAPTPAAAQHGGLILRQQLLRAGEGDRPEAIIPLRDPRALQSIGQAVGSYVTPGGGGGAPMQLTLVMQPAKGEPMARAQLWGRTAINAAEAEVRRSTVLGTAGRSQRRRKVG